MIDCHTYLLLAKREDSLSCHEINLNHHSSNRCSVNYGWMLRVTCDGLLRHLFTIRRLDAALFEYRRPILLQTGSSHLPQSFQYITVCM